MICLAISWLPLNTSLCIKNLQFPSVLWPHPPRKQLNNFQCIYDSANLFLFIGVNSLITFNVFMTQQTYFFLVNKSNSNNNKHTIL